MTDVVIAPREEDARAAEAVKQHHAQMSGVLAGHVERLVAAVTRSDAAAAEAARELLSAWCEGELLPHAKAEEAALYPAAQRTVEGRLLVEGMVAEHETIGALVRAVAAGAGDLVRVVADAAALRAVFESHLAKENDLVVPLLLGTPGVSVAALLGGMHELLGEGADHAAEPTGGCGSGHACSCGEVDPAGHPELDARTIPHSIRHATIFGALETVPAGGGLVLVASHDPLPLLAQLEQRWPGRFSVTYEERGPEVWRLSLARAAA